MALLRQYRKRNLTNWRKFQPLRICIFEYLMSSICLQGPLHLLWICLQGPMGPLPFPLLLICLQGPMGPLHLL